MKSVLRPLAALALAAFLPACGDFKGYYVPFPNTVAGVLLRGSQVVPALGTGASGTATVTVDGLGKFIDYTIDATGLGTLTAVEIRLGVPGTNGPKIFTIPLAAFPMSGRLLPVNLTPQTGATTFGEACAQVADGNAYLLISTSTFSTGEIRGHIGQAALASAALTGSQVVTPVATTASGSATVQLNAAQDEFSVTLSVSGLTGGITAAQIFDGAPLTAGTTALFSLAALPFTSPLTVTLKATDFTASAGITTFPDAINALLSGGLHILVLTGGFPAGEIRGQVGPTQLNAVLTSGDVFPVNSSTATGAATIALNATQTDFFVTLTHTVGTPTAATIHADDPGSNGPQIFDVDAIAGAAASPVSTTLRAIHLIPQPSKGISTFPDAINALLTGKTYVDVGSTGFPVGEIRGQILP